MITIEYMEQRGGVAEWVDAVESWIADGHVVRETPHLGGPLSGLGKYAFSLGLATNIAAVDTISARRDTLGEAGVIGDAEVISRTKGNRMIAGALQSIQIGDEDGQVAKAIKTDKVVKAIESTGVENVARFVEGDTVRPADFHLFCLQSVVSARAEAVTFAEYWRKTGEAGLAMMEYVAQQGMVKRWFDAESGKQVAATLSAAEQLRLIETEGHYFDSQDSVHGVLPPLVSLFAIEIVQAAIEGREVTYDHLYALSTQYTREPGFNDRVIDVAAGTLASLGACYGDVRYRYITADNARLDYMGGGFDLLQMVREGEHFDARALLAKKEEQ